jgi:hypothetical protein
MSAAPTSVVLATFPGQTQQQNNWCWAAVCASINNYYADASSQVMQCDIVNEAFGTTYCCQEPDQYDIPWYLDLALEQVNHLNYDEAGPMAFGVIAEQIGVAQCPVAARIGLPDGGDHSVVICGYSEQNGALLVWDPNGYYLQTTVADWLEDLGDWLNTYLTK